MLHAAHPTIPRPAHLVVVTDHVLIVRVGVLCEETLDEVTRLLLRESKDHDESIQVSAVQPDGMSQLRIDILESQEFVRKLRRPRHLRGPSEAKLQEVQYKAIILEHKRTKLQTLDEAIRVCVVHVLVIDHDVVLGGHVVGNIVVHNQPQQAVEQGQVDLLGHILELRLKHHNALAVRGVPHICQVIDTLTPLVHQQRRWLGVCRLDPIGEQVAMVALVPKVLIKVCIRDLLQGLDLVARRQVGVHVLELNRHLLEGTLSQQVPLDAAQRLMRIVVGLLDQTQLLTLLLVQPRLHGVLLLQPLQGQDEQFGVVLVIERREGNGRELPRLQPVHGRGVDRHSLLATDVRAILQVVVLALLLSLQPEAS
mmetsp:Transcript_100146/g.251032  ORF Transcript_100146/g.251032 Transcript_100146/m.251032 type:complete len:367 (+) Transcript_100146:3702-4802(+)